MDTTPITDTVDALRRIADRPERVRAAGALLDALAAAQADAAELRRADVAAMRADGKKLREIAAETGSSLARVSQILKAKPRE